MALGDIWKHSDLGDRRNLYIALTAPIIITTAFSLVRPFFVSRRERQPRIYRSPLATVQQLAPHASDTLPYPPAALPGARDVSSPYGSIRVYEWGPETGRKVLFVHGISTPCVAFASMAKLLVERHGCRVMLFDLFGRGYSDAPDPEIYRQDTGLWTSQILLVLTSSPLTWSGGGERFALVGYSMGGGIAASFASWFPEMVESLVLIAPGGLLRRNRISTSSKLLYGKFLPNSMVEYFVGRRLRGNTPPPRQPGDGKESPTEAAQAEVPSHPAHARDSDAQLFPDRPDLSVAEVVNWELDSHPGFVGAFISSIQYAPVSDEHERWRAIGERCVTRRQQNKRASSLSMTAGLEQNKVLVLLGQQDSVIVADETEEDAVATLGPENVIVRRLDGGHDVPIVNSKDCVKAIWDFWNESVV